VDTNSGRLQEDQMNRRGWIKTTGALGVGCVTTNLGSLWQDSVKWSNELV
jgi:hypothetical protein